jgi:hypothetical protein
MMTTAQAIREREKSSAWDFFSALDMALACLIGYSVITCVLSPLVDRPDALRGLFTAHSTGNLVVAAPRRLDERRRPEAVLSQLANRRLGGTGR